MSNGWSDHVSDDVAARRAGGRARYNAVRHVRRELRRAEVVALLGRMGTGRGVQATIARRLGVNRSTICRDVRAILAELNGGPCPFCGMDWADPVGSIRERLTQGWYG